MLFICSNLKLMCSVIRQMYHKQTGLESRDPEASVPIPASNQIPVIRGDTEATGSNFNALVQHLADLPLVRPFFHFELILQIKKYAENIVHSVLRFDTTYNFFKYRFNIHQNLQELTSRVDFNDRTEKFFSASFA